MHNLKLEINPAESSAESVSEIPANKGRHYVAARGFPDFPHRMLVSGRWMLAADICALILAYCGGATLVLLKSIITNRSISHIWFYLATPRQFIVFWAIGLSAILWLDSRGHYRQRLPYWEMVGHILSVATICFLASGFIEFASHSMGSRLWDGFCWGLFACFSLACRALARHHLERTGSWRIPAVIVGEGPTAKAALRALSRDTQLGFKIIDQLPSSVLEDMKKTLAWTQALMLHGAHYIFLALEGSEIERYQAALKSLPRARVPCSIIPPWLGLPSSTLTPHHFMMQDVMMLHDTNRLKLPLARLIKRFVDVILASTALLFLLPLLAVVALIVRSEGSPVLFKQPRVGQGGRLFECYKFRSMRPDAEEVLARYLAQNPEAAEEWRKFQKLKNDVRVTKFGRFIRRASIDELPQLINVLKGDMSLVGPRPCMQGQERLYAEDFSFYESVRPGITGPWQVSGRNDLTFKERVYLEAWYARNWSLWLDIVIMLKTVPTLLQRGRAF